VEDERVPLSPSAVRSECSLAGWHISPRGPSNCHVNYISLSDVKGWIPGVIFRSLFLYNLTCWLACLSTYLLTYWLNYCLFGYLVIHLHLSSLRHWSKWFQLRFRFLSRKLRLISEPMVLPLIMKNLLVELQKQSSSATTHPHTSSSTLLILQLAQFLLWNFLRRFAFLPLSWLFQNLCLPWSFSSACNLSFSIGKSLKPFL